MWKDKIKSYSSFVKYSGPVPAKDIIKFKKIFSFDLPVELHQILIETNGIIGEYGMNIIWTLEKIISENIRFRNDKELNRLYKSFNNLLFFSDAGNGDQFAYSIIYNKAVKNDIYIWNHEDDSRPWIASSMDDFLKRWLSGELKI